MKRREAAGADPPRIWHHRGVSSEPLGRPGGRDEQRRRAAEIARDEEPATGRRRRAPGEKGFDSAFGGQASSVADRQEIITVPVAPTSRLVSISIAGFAGLLGLALVLSAYTVPRSYALVIFVVQVLFVTVWTVSTRPPAPGVVAGVGLVAAAVADVMVGWPTHATIAPLGYVTVGAFVLGMIGQLLRRDGRTRVTESVGATLSVVLGVVAFAMLIVLRRHDLGKESIAACLAAATVGIVVARSLDVILPFPRTTPQVARGTIGILVGAMAGTVAAAVVASGLVGMHPSRTVIAGLVTAVVAVLADLGVNYAEASREIDGDVGSLWLVRHMQGPLGAFALVVPVAYAMSVMVLVPALT